MEALAIPCMDPDNATDGCKKLYSMYAQGIRALDTGNLTEVEKKAITNSLRNANKTINMSCEEQKKCRANGQILKSVEQRVVDVSKNLANKEIHVAKLRTDYSTIKLNLQLSQANLEKLIATCRALAVQTNQIVMDNKKLEDEAHKSYTHWDNAKSRLGQYLEKMTILTDNSPKLNSRNQKSKIVADLQKKVEELQELKVKLTERQKMLTEEDDNTGEEDFARYVGGIAKTLLKFYSNMERFKTHLAEKQVLIEKEAEKTAAQENIIDMSMAELDDTGALLQGDYAEEEPDEVMPPPATREELYATKDQVVRNYIEQQKSPEPIENVQSPSVQIIEDPTPADNEPNNTDEEAILTEDVPEPEQVASQENFSQNMGAAVTNPADSHTFSQYDTGLSQDIGNLDVNFDTDAILDISMNSNDPGGDFLSMMNPDASEKEKTTSGGDDFSFSMFTGTDTAGGGGETDGFNFDMMGGGGDAPPESSFNFNFSTDNNESSQNANTDNFDFGFSFS